MEIDMKHTKETLGALILAALLPGTATAQTEGAELAASGLFIGRYVAAIAPAAAAPQPLEEVRVIAPRVRASADFLAEISRQLDATLETRLGTEIGSGS